MRSRPSRVRRARPRHVQATVLAMPEATCGGILCQRFVDAGPVTAKGRSNTLQSAGAKGPMIPVHAVHDRLRKWQREMQRLHTRRPMPPDPSVQINTITQNPMLSSFYKSEFLLEISESLYLDRNSG